MEPARGDVGQKAKIKSAAEGQVIATHDHIKQSDYIPLTSSEEG
jgi:hypothetical protein